ncbi:phospholipase [Roseateles puraquae]|uniref:Phospholipase n=2 Tax=Roseateles puraquae TaxID=431059 RepID=A0A254NBB4_9BURK|nr:phospholipase [Roseateles puraquae]
MCYRAFERMPEVAQAAPVRAEPLVDFLRAQEAAIARTLEAQEAWARQHLPQHAPRPEALRFRVDAARSDEQRRAAFLRALRLSPQTRLALYLQPDPREAEPSGPRLDASVVSAVTPSKGATQRFVALAPGDGVAPLAVLASACDEPDYGHDLNLFDDNPGHPDYGFGKQPFGNPAVAIGSQAPFHMGFFHQGAIFNTLAPSFARTFTELRVQQYGGLAVLAWQTGHAYWGWRFAGLALHHVQDLTQPYHASAAPGATLGHMMWVNLKAQLGAPADRQGLVVLQGNRHFVLEQFQTRWILENARQRRDGPLELALRDAALDARYPPWSPAYVREVVAAEAFAAGPATDAAVVVGAPAKFVSDPNFDFAANEAQLGPELARDLQGQRDALHRAIANLLGHFGAHSRNALRGLRQAAGQVPS